MLYLRRTRGPRGKRHAKATGSFPLRLVGDRSGLRPTRTASGFPSATPPPASLSSCVVASASPLSLAAPHGVLPQGLQPPGFVCWPQLVLDARNPLVCSYADVQTLVLKTPRSLARIVTSIIKANLVWPMRYAHTRAVLK